MNQSRPRWLCAEGAGARGRARPATGGTNSYWRPTACARSRLSGRRRGTDRARSLSSAQCSKSEGCRLPDAPSTTTGVPSLYSGAAFTWSCVNSSVMLSLLLATPPKCERVPVDHDLPAADAEEAAEIDHGGANHARPIHDHIDDPPHVLIARAPHFASQHAMGIGGTDHGDRWRRRRCLARGLCSGRRVGGGGIRRRRTGVVSHRIGTA